MHKEYLALVRGRTREDGGTIDLPLETQKRSRGNRPRVEVGDGKAALTVWQVEQRFGRHTLLRVFPKTGRQHQVRAHLSAIGHPLVVDRRYGGGEQLLLSEIKRGYRPSADGERPLLARTPLHAHRLGAVSPSGEPLELEAPLPQDMAVALRQLAKYD